ncbi:MAG: DUF309 domain-containing protein [Phycisphaerales bacterium]
MPRWTTIRLPDPPHRPGRTVHPARRAESPVPQVDALAAGWPPAREAARTLLPDGPPAELDLGGLDPVHAAAIAAGIDLHEGGAWWEAHEAWEIPWRAWPVGDSRRPLVQALIIDAATWLAMDGGRVAGVRRLRDRSAKRRAEIDPSAAKFAGIDHRERERTVDVFVSAWMIGDRSAQVVPPALFPID